MESSELGEAIRLNKKNDFEFNRFHSMLNYTRYADTKIINSIAQLFLFCEHYHYYVHTYIIYVIGTIALRC